MCKIGHISKMRHRHGECNFRFIYSCSLCGNVAGKQKDTNGERLAVKSKTSFLCTCNGSAVVLTALYSVLYIGRLTYSQLITLVQYEIKSMSRSTHKMLSPDGRRNLSRWLKGGIAREEGSIYRFLWKVNNAQTIKGNNKGKGLMISLCTIRIQMHIK